MIGHANLSSAPEPFKSFLDQLSINMAAKGESIFVNFQALSDHTGPKRAHIADIGTSENLGEFFQRHTNASLIIWDTGINLYGQNPYGMNTNCEYANVYEYIDHLSDDGIALFPTFTSGLSTKNGKKLTSLLQLKGYGIYGYIELPSYIYGGSSNYLFAIVKKGLFDNIVLYSIKGLENQFEAKSAANFLTGMFQSNSEQKFEVCKPSEFSGFDKFRLGKEVEALLSNDANFERVVVGSLVEEISWLEISCEYLSENQVVMNSIATTSRRDISFSDIKKINKNHKLFKLTFNNNIDRDYFCSFFNTDLGKKLFLSAASGGHMPKVTMDKLKALEIPCPPKSVQQMISRTSDSLRSLYSQIDNLYQELVYNPRNAEAVFSDVSKLLDSIGKLGLIDKIKSEIRSGEGKHIEFKETIALCMRENERKDYVETAILKTICGFLNSDGGVLIVGVNDFGVINGVDHEMNKLYKNSNDEYLKKVRNMIHSKIGIDLSEFLDWNIHDIEGKKVLRFVIKASKTPVFINKIDFYIRTNPATDKLEGEQLVSYIRQHFPQI